MGGQASLTSARGGETEKAAVPDGQEGPGWPWLSKTEDCPQTMLSPEAMGVDRAPLPLGVWPRARAGVWSWSWCSDAGREVSEEGRSRSPSRGFTGPLR